MQLLAKYHRQKLPPLFATRKEKDPIVVCKFISPDIQWDRYVIEFDGEDICYGFKDGDYPGVYYFSLIELMSTRAKDGHIIQRDQSFRSCRLSELRKRLGR